ncbi:DBH-like monooxygenase protein 1 [Stylophora pistillata]|nr:DBH-like monooxygenase protein 1 [Stylophora pistillata]
MLLNSMDKRNINETSWLSFTVTTNNVTIPTKETTYWCSLIKAPELQSKHHVTKVEPLVQKGNEGFVHHLILYECEGNYTESDYDQGKDCMDTANMPYARCRDASIVVAWAVGGEAFYYPLHAGFPLGADDSPKNFLLEMHYDNPSNTPGRVDSSGIRIYYTDKLRKYDSGIMSVGVRVNNWHIIPPKQKDWVSVGYCTAECTESILNSTHLQGGGINVFASILHTHLAGRATWTRHIRNGKELPEIARDDHYDFNFQDTQVLRKEINIQPGDEMINYCKYSSTDRDQLIEGGLASREEMCLDFLFYYPRIPNARSCESTAYGPPYKFIKKYLKDVSLTSPRRNPMTKMSFDWTDEMVADFKEYNEDVQRVFPRCGIRRYSSVADTINPNYTVPIPKVTEPLPSEESDCTPIPFAASLRTSPGVYAGYLGILCAVLCILNH